MKASRALVRTPTEHNKVTSWKILECLPGYVGATHRQPAPRSLPHLSASLGVWPVSMYL